MAEPEPQRKHRPRKNAKPKAIQQTLKDIFGSRTSSLISAVQGASYQNVSTEVLNDSLKDIGNTSEEIIETSAQSHGVRVPSARQPIRPIPSRRIPVSHTTRMFAIFEKPKQTPSPQPIEVLDTPDTEIIDITHSDDALSMVGSNSQHPPRPPTPPTGGSQEDPIVVESSPMKLSSPHEGHAWSVYQRKATQLRASFKGQRKPTEGLYVPFPNSISQHTRGPQSQFLPGASPFVHRVYQRHNEMGISPTEDLGHILRHHTTHQPPAIGDHCSVTVTPSSYDAAYIHTIPKLHQRYPAVSRSLSRVNGHLSSRFSISQEAWTEKWRPRRADEVIGNEEKALYLRDWLTALRLQMIPSTDQGTTESKKSGKRKPRKNGKLQVVRHIRKKRKTEDGLAGFLASDNEDESHVDYVNDTDRDELDFLGYSSAATPDVSSQYSCVLSEPEDDPSETSDSSPIAYTPPNFTSRIHNTILLAGPSGCGKTAAVYACAEELGWEVFEVYPGVGDRSGPELNKLIGDIGRNHIVHSASRRPPGRQYSYFSRTTKTIIRVESEDEDCVSSAESSIHTDALLVPVVEPAIKQSLVLIEEVDILYNSDAGFWPAIINIIKDCRRPVVMTCNDTTLVPWADIPLQTTLYFTSCPADLAASYLQASCLSEGFTIDRDSLVSLYNGSLDPSSGSHPIPRDVCRSDLRFSVNQLQYQTSMQPEANSTPSPVFRVSHSGTESTSPIDHNVAAASSSIDKDRQLMQQVFRLRDTMSYAEDQLLRDPTHLAELYNEPPDASDVELGYAVLPLELFSHLPSVSAFYTQDRLISQDVVSLSSGKSCGSASPDRSELSAELLDCDRFAFETQISDVLSNCLRPTPCLNDRSALFTDYLPWIRYMVDVDNSLEELVWPSGTQQRRQTRTSKRASQERHIPLEDAQLEVLSKTAFRVDSEDGCL